MVKKIDPSKKEEESQTKTKSRWQDFIQKVKNLSPLINVIVGFATVTIAAYAVFQYCAFQDFSETENRAFLSISKPMYDPHKIYIWNLNNGVKIDSAIVKRVKFSVKNSGNTPALNVRDSTHFKYLTCKPELVKGANEARVYFYAPGDNIAIKSLDDKFERMPGAHAYFYGKINYSDIFGGNHWVTFCYQYIKAHDYFIVIGKNNQTGSY